MLMGWPASVNSSGPTYRFAQLLGRKQREAAPAGDHAGDVVRDVVVRLHRHAIADPDARHDRGIEQRQRVVAREPGQARGVGHARPRTAPAARARRAAASSWSSECGERLRAALEIEAGQVVVVEETPADGRIAEHGVGGRAGVEAAQVVSHGRGRFAAGAHRGPVAHRAAQHRGLPGRQDLIAERARG